MRASAIARPRYRNRHTLIFRYNAMIDAAKMARYLQIQCRYRFLDAVSYAAQYFSVKETALADFCEGLNNATI